MKSKRCIGLAQYLGFNYNYKIDFTSIIIDKLIKLFIRY